MDKKKRLKGLIIVSVLAMLVSLYLVYQHYKEEPTAFCTFGASFNCDTVNKSIYSNVDGIFYLLGNLLNIPVLLSINIPFPVSLIGFLVFLYIFCAASSIKNNRPLFRIKQKKLIKSIKILLWLGLLFAVYLLLVEIFVLKTYCILCLTLDLLILIALILSLRL